MRLWMIVLALCLPFAAMAGEAKPMAKDPVLEQRMIALSENLRCLVCQNESLAGSHAELAEDLRQEIREQLHAGKTNEQVIEYLTERYGDFVLYKPPVKPITWLLWFGPFALLIGAMGGLYSYIKRRGNRLVDEPLSEEEKKRVAALIGNNGNKS